MKESMYEAMQELAKVTARRVEGDTAEQQGTASSRKGKRKGGGRMVATEASNMAHAAKNAVKKGKEATGRELACLRAVLAGHMPKREEREASKKEESKRRTMTRRAVRAIRTAQEASAQMQEAWYKEAKGEIAQRNAEEGIRKWMGPAIGAWTRARQTWRLNAAGRRVERESEEEGGGEDGGRGAGGTGRGEDGDTQEGGTEGSRHAV